MCEPSKLTNLFTLLPKVRTHWRRRVFYFKMARKKEHSRKFHYEVLHYLKHKALYKTTKLCWDENKKEYVTTFFFHFGETFKKMGVEVII